MSTRWHSYLQIHSWDIPPISIDNALDVAAGELGVDGIRISAVTTAVCRLAARADISPRTFRCEAAAHFQPDARRYADTRLRPPTAAWIKSRNPLAQITEACARRELKLRLGITACDNETIIERHAHAACKDAFGEPSPARLCPANPDVRTYLRSLIADLTTHYAPAAIDIADADFGSIERFHPGRAQPAAPHDPHSLALCFCESCRQAAGEYNIDAEALAQHIVESFDAGRAPDAERLRPYEHFRVKMVEELVSGLHGPPETELWWDTAGDDPHRALPAAAIDERMAGQIIEHDRPAVVHMPSERIAIAYALGVERPIEDGGATVVRDVSELTARGHRTFIFDSFATMPVERNDWVRQAVRFARRQASGG